MSNHIVYEQTVSSQLILSLFQIQIQFIKPQTNVVLIIIYIYTLHIHVYIYSVVQCECIARRIFSCIVIIENIESKNMKLSFRFSLTQKIEPSLCSESEIIQNMFRFIHHAPRGWDRKRVKEKERNDQQICILYWTTEPCTTYSTVLLLTNESSFVIFTSYPHLRREAGYDGFSSESDLNDAHTKNA